MEFKIKQIIPNNEGFRMGSQIKMDGSEAGFDKIVCWALVEYEDQSTKVFPMIKGVNTTSLCVIDDAPNTDLWIADPEQ